MSAFSRRCLPSDAGVDIDDEPAFPTMELTPTQNYVHIMQKMDSILTGDVDVSALIQVKLTTFTRGLGGGGRLVMFEWVYRFTHQYWSHARQRQKCRTPKV